MDSVTERAADIRLLVLDVDGVLTNGRLFFSAQGEEMKSFHVRDGAGIVQVLRAGLAVAVISGRSSLAVERRMATVAPVFTRAHFSEPPSVPKSYGPVEEPDDVDETRPPQRASVEATDHVAVVLPEPVPNGAM